MSETKAPIDKQISEAPPDPSRTPHPNGHFYSPICNRDDLLPRVDKIWPGNPQILGIDFNDASHEKILSEMFPKFIGDYQYPELEGDDPTKFFTQNSQFSWLDSRSLFVLLREWQPKRIIEVGSGFSSLLMADVNHRYFNSASHITCIEPYPRQFLKEKIAGLNRVIEQKVQDVALTVFDELQSGDILFIDSSHVSKTDSDVNYLFFEVLPRLRPGVKIHIHDIFLPHDYKKEWVLEDNRSWNEQYLLRALLMHSAAFRVLFGCCYGLYRYPELVKSALGLPGGRVFAGGSFWIERSI